MAMAVLRATEELDGATICVGRTRVVAVECCCVEVQPLQGLEQRKL